MNGKGLLEDQVYKDIYLDNRTGMSIKQRKDRFFSILGEAIKADGSLFQWFLKVLIDAGTLLLENRAQRLTKKYEELAAGNYKYTFV